jgi:hypothetical protein
VLAEPTYIEILTLGFGSLGALTGLLVALTLLISEGHPLKRLIAPIPAIALLWVSMRRDTALLRTGGFWELDELALFASAIFSALFLPSWFSHSLLLPLRLDRLWLGYVVYSTLCSLSLVGIIGILEPYKVDFALVALGGALFGLLQYVAVMATTVMEQRRNASMEPPAPEPADETPPAAPPPPPPAPDRNAQTPS